MRYQSADNTREGFGVRKDLVDYGGTVRRERWSTYLVDAYVTMRGGLVKVTYTVCGRGGMLEFDIFQRDNRDLFVHV